MKIGRQWWVAAVLFVICVIFCGDVFGKDTIDLKNLHEFKRENEIQILMAAAVTATNSDTQNDVAVSDGNGESVTIGDGEEDKSSFIVKLGTFLLISSVLIFALQWHQKKKDR